LVQLGLNVKLELTFRANMCVRDR